MFVDRLKHVKPCISNPSEIEVNCLPASRALPSPLVDQLTGCSKLCSQAMFLPLPIST